MSFLRKIDGDKLMLISGDSFLLIEQEEQSARSGAKSAGRAGGAMFR